MKLSLVAQPLTDAEGDVLVVGHYAEEKRLTPTLAGLDRKLGRMLSDVLKSEKFEGKPEQMSHFYTAGRIPAKAVLVVGFGKRRELDAERLRRVSAVALRRARDLGAKIVSTALLGEGLPVKVRAQAIAEAALLGTYAFDRYKKERSNKAVEELRVVEPDRRNQAAVRDGLRVAEIFAESACYARDLVNEPANRVTPTYLAKMATEIAKEGKLKLRVYDREECRKLGMGAYLGVAQGSAEPPKFIHLTYTPRRRARKKIAIIGKGITFDSGGLDLKTADGMRTMKDDMAGAAAVLGLMRALPKLDLPVEVHGVIAATENMPSGTAQRPGDIVRCMNGTTIEIGNTDAEGRLTLADALAYAVKEIEPREIVDLATLTGACVIALGPLCSGVMWNNKPLADRILAAAEGAGERMWPLPLIEEYKEGLKSDVADLNNVGPRGGGALTAGLFLREFAGEVPWVHIDIAGPAFTEKDLPLGPKGGTGVGVRTLLTYLMQEAARR
ncbi:MAG: leucyl aminopeptidase [Candidatus Rokubacteria bacterium]|nr:leucyl aminopeptidase [Candidatus Rokubacteria bacterium]